jgi:hypothetical protein
MSDVVQTRGAGLFGDCPERGSNDGYLNVIAEHWFHCREHATKWCAGANLFSGWREESEEDWRRNIELLADYTEVESPLPTRAHPRSREEFFEEMRAKGWIEEGDGSFRNPAYPEGSLSGMAKGGR